MLGGVLLAGSQVLLAPAAFAEPALALDGKPTGLKDGQKRTVTGTGFTPDLERIAVGQCRVGYVGPGDCNLQGGAVFRNADAEGSIGSITLTLMERFGDVDCTVEKCVIAAAPLPTAVPEDVVAANTAEIPVVFGDAPAPAAPRVGPLRPPASRRPRRHRRSKRNPSTCWTTPSPSRSRPATAKARWRWGSASWPASSPAAA